jgi:quinol monooxygenase YgiN
MWMVIGEQRGTPGDAEERAAQFAHMAEVTRQSPGFVSGWWGADDDDPELSHALVILDSLEHARALRRMVAENVTGVRLRIMEIGVAVPPAS